MVAEAPPANLQQSGVTYFSVDFADSWMCFTERSYLHTGTYSSSVYRLLVVGDQYIERQHTHVNGATVVVSDSKGKEEEVWSGTG